MEALCSASGTTYADESLQKQLHMQVAVAYSQAAFTISRAEYSETRSCKLAAERSTVMRKHSVMQHLCDALKPQIMPKRSGCTFQVVLDGNKSRVTAIREVCIRCTEQLLNVSGMSLPCLRMLRSNSASIVSVEHGCIAPKARRLL